VIIKAGETEIFNQIISGAIKTLIMRAVPNKYIDKARKASVTR